MGTFFSWVLLSSSLMQEGKRKRGAEQEEGRAGGGEQEEGRAGGGEQPLLSILKTAREAAKKAW